MIPPLLFISYMGGAGNEMNGRVLGRGLELVGVNAERFAMNQISFACR